MKRALLAVALSGGLLAFMSACGSEGRPPGPANTQDQPVTPAKKDLTAPDSVKGDTAYYSYKPRGASRTDVLGTFDGSWHRYKSHMCTGLDTYRRGRSNVCRWMLVQAWLQLLPVSNDSAVAARAQELIRARGDVVIFSGAGGAGYWQVRPAARSMPDSVAWGSWLPASVPLLEWIYFYDQHEDVFRSVSFFTQLELL